jgi:hypothetical protein
MCEGAAVLHETPSLSMRVVVGPFAIVVERVCSVVLGYSRQRVSRPGDRQV